MAVLGDELTDNLSITWTEGADGCFRLMAQEIKTEQRGVLSSNLRRGRG